MDFTRRRLLTGSKPPVRPPWAMPEARFLDLCTACGDCIRACPHGLLRHGAGRYPVIEPARGGCDFCGDCAARCRPGALRAGLAAADAFAWRARPGTACLAHRAVECRVCGEACAAGAIRFARQAGGPARPRVEPAECTGCGQCLASCPANAIELEAA